MSSIAGFSVYFPTFSLVARPQFCCFRCTIKIACVYLWFKGLWRQRGFRLLQLGVARTVSRCRRATFGLDRLHLGQVWIRRSLRLLYFRLRRGLLPCGFLDARVDHLPLGGLRRQRGFRHRRHDRLVGGYTALAEPGSAGLPEHFSRRIFFLGVLGLTAGGLDLGASYLLRGVRRFGVGSRLLCQRIAASN